MINIFGYAFFQNALAIAVLAGIACGIIGTFVVVKRISFISGSIAHSAFGGIGLGYFLGINPLLSAIVFSVLSALGIGYASKKAKQRDDTAIAAMWAVGMGIGLIFIYLTPGYAGDLFSYLFGNILLVSRADLWLVGLLDLIILGSVYLLFNSLVAITFDEEYSTVLNLPVFKLYLFLLSLIALTVVVLIKAVGIILVVLLLTLPAATAEMFFTDLKKIMVCASFIATSSMVLGIFASYWFNLPAGPVIIFVSAIAFGLGWMLKKIS